MSCFYLDTNFLIILILIDEKMNNFYQKRRKLFFVVILLIDLLILVYTNITKLMIRLAYYPPEKVCKRSLYEEI